MIAAPLERLEQAVTRHDRLTVALSGGIDSMTLAAAAHRWLGVQARMAHAVSAAVPKEATARVTEHAQRHGWRLTLVDAGELADPNYLANPVNRCLFCKRNLYGTLRRLDDGAVAAGTNLDDLGDYRPGLEAARESGVVHPFVEAGIDKATIRVLARELGLGDLAELPASPCLSSRLETGIGVTPARLELVHRVELHLEQRFGPGDQRCRIRAGGIAVELPETVLAALSPLQFDQLIGEVGEIVATTDLHLPVTVSAYRRGSAFLRKAP